MPTHPLHPSVSYGEADTFWDVSFDPKHMDRLDLHPDDPRSISVWIDPKSGAVELNKGYEEGSPEDRREATLFGEYRDMIVDELASAIQSLINRLGVDRVLEYAAFMRGADVGREVRKARLETLYSSMTDD